MSYTGNKIKKTCGENTLPKRKNHWAEEKNSARFRKSQIIKLNIPNYLIFFFMSFSYPFHFKWYKYQRIAISLEAEFEQASRTLKTPVSI